MAWSHETHQILSFNISTAQNGPSAAFIAGSAAPDAFKTLSSSFHTVEFASFLLSMPISSSHSFPDFGHPNPELDFALGYCCHIIQDAVAHHTHSVSAHDYHGVAHATDALLQAHNSQRYRQFGMITDDLTVFISHAASDFGIKGTSLQILRQIVAVFNSDGQTHFDHYATENLNEQMNVIREKMCSQSKHSWPAVQRALEWSAEASRFMVAKQKASPHTPAENMQSALDMIDTLFEESGGKICGKA